jgi:hypothetical protein
MEVLLCVKLELATGEFELAKSEFEPGPHINAVLTAARWFDLAFMIDAFDFPV